MKTKKNPAVTAESLQAKSDAAVVAFKTLVTDLKTTNDEADAARIANENQIAVLQAENAAIAAMTAKNAKIVQNVEKLLSV